MSNKSTNLDGTHIFPHTRIHDSRGYFLAFWYRNEFQKTGIDSKIAQANISFNKNKGTLRGFHFQKEPFEEAKTLICLQGRIFDVLIDLRKNSKTFLMWNSYFLSSEDSQSLFIPKGIAHAYQTLEKETTVLYFVSDSYKPEAEDGIRYDDPFFNIEWPLEITSISKKDEMWPDFNPEKWGI